MRAVLRVVCSASAVTVVLASGGLGGCLDLIYAQQHACEPTLEGIEKAIFRPSCSQGGCHSLTEPAAGLALTGPDLARALIGGPSALCYPWRLVVPGKPRASLLLRKVDGTPPCGDPMPNLGKHLEDVDLACLVDWIEQVEPLPPLAGCETCGGAQCVDLATDNLHCGECGAPCPPGSACHAEVCECGEGLTLCGTACVDTNSNSAHCGGCGILCAVGALCDPSGCVCPSQTTECEGVCVDTQSHPSYCGDCLTPCTSPEVCLGGGCSAGCGTLTDCSGACVDTESSVFHCGDCGIPCPTGAGCIGGLCQCPVGSTACGGACINTATDPNNCGDCSNACALGTTCQGSACVCPGDEQICAGGCVDTEVSLSHCGACGNACSPGQDCVLGECTCAGGAVSFSSTVQPIFTATCAVSGCHRSGGAQPPPEDLDLGAGKAHANLVNVPTSQCNGSRVRVEPGQPDMSYLMDKLLDVDLCTGGPMPKRGVALTTAQLEAISTWICNGAPNN